MLIILDNGGILARRRERKPRGYNYNRIRKDTEEEKENLGDTTITELERIKKKRKKT